MKFWSDPLRRRWIIWGALATGFLLVNIHRLSTAVLSDGLMRLFDITGTELGTLHSAFFYIYAPMQIGAGVVADRWGIRRTATTGLLLMSIAAIAFALSNAYVVALVARITIGLGGSIVFIATLRFCANWYRPGEYGTMNGLTVAVAGVGSIVATTPLAVNVTALGIQSTLLLLGGLGFVVVVIVWTLTRDTPEKAGLPPLENVDSAPPLSLRAVGQNVRTVLGETETWLAGFALFTSSGINITVLGLWGLPYIAQVYNRSTTAASTVLMAGSIGLLLGPPLIGRLSDVIGRRTGLMAVSGSLFTASYALLAITGHPPLWVVGAVFFSVSFLGGGLVLAYTVVQNRHGTAASGVAVGTVNAIGFSGAAVFPTVMGALLDTYWTGETVNGVRVYTQFGYRVLFALAALAGLVSLLCALTLHYRTR